MRIAIDARAANTPQPTGVEYYNLKLIENLLQIGPEHEYTLLVSEPLTPALRSLGAAANTVGRILTPRKFWPFVRLPLEFALHPGRYDLFFSPVFAIPYLSVPRNVATFHDLAYEFFPQYFTPYERYRQRFFSRLSARKADQLIAVSESTKKDLIKLYGIDESRITVIHNSYNRDLFRPQDEDKPTRRACLPKPEGSVVTLAERRRVLENPYLLFVGTMQGRKGVDQLLRAFDLFKQRQHTNHKLVLVGKKGWRDARIWAVYQSMQHQDDVIVTGYVAEKDLPGLYAQADLFILPSLYEGFGMPVLEAQAMGTPVVTSDVSSLLEVGGDAAYYVDPCDVEEIAEAIADVVLHRQLSQSLIERGLVNVNRFSWERAARQTLAVFEETFRRHR